MALLNSIYKIVHPIVKFLSERESLFVSSGHGTYNVITGEIQKFINQHMDKITFEETKYFFLKAMNLFYGEKWLLTLNKNTIALIINESRQFFLSVNYCL